MIPADLAALKQCYNCLGYGHEKVNCPTTPRRPAAVATAQHQTPGPAGNRGQWVPRAHQGRQQPMTRSNHVEISGSALPQDDVGTVTSGSHAAATGPEQTLMAHQQSDPNQQDSWLDDLGHGYVHEWYGHTADE